MPLTTCRSCGKIVWYGEVKVIEKEKLVCSNCFKKLSNPSSRGRRFNR